MPHPNSGSSCSMFNRAQLGVTGITESNSNLSVKFLDSTELGDPARLVGLRCKEHSLSEERGADFAVLDSPIPPRKTNKNARVLGLRR